MLNTLSVRRQPTGRDLMDASGESYPKHDAQAGSAAFAGCPSFARIGAIAMTSERLLERILPPLLAGQRQACRDVLSEVLDSGMQAEHVYRQVMWPAMEQVARMYRNDQINRATEHMATRISRALVDQLQTHLPRQDANGKSVVMMCADDEPEELGAQMCADLFESNGWTVYFVGGGVPNDEVLTLVGQTRPDVLLIFGTQP